MTWGRIAHPSELLRIGDKLTVKVLSFDRVNEKISLGMKQLADNPWDALATTIVPGARLTGRISSINDHRFFFVELAKGIEGMVHISEISWTDRISDLHKHFKVGESIEVYVVSVDKEARRISLSIKQLQKSPWEEVSKQFSVGQKIKGKISNITDFGLFVQLVPGIDGLVRISDISWTEHIAHPSDHYKKGEEVEAVVLGIDEQEYPVGRIVEGEVTKITNFGAFVKLPTGIEGLVRLSELSLDEQVDKVEDFLKVGQKYQFRVIKLNQEEQRIALSLKLSDETEAPATRFVKREPRSNPKRESRRSSQHDEYTNNAPQSPKAKSALQLELEKHAARRDKRSRDDENSDE
jgi:small subunit ribosomal protein S1